MTRSPFNSLDIWDCYIDESSQSKHRYTVIGGVILPKDTAVEVTARIMQTRLPDLPNGEMKWGKVSNTKLATYKRIVDLFFDRAYATNWHFHSLFGDTTKQDHAKFNKGSRDIGFNKEIFQLSRKLGRLYPHLFHIYPDRRDTSQSTEDLRLMLNRHIQNSGDKRDWPYRRVQFRDSKSCPLVQVADILTGAIAYKLNEHDLVAGASPAKTALCKHILRRAGVANPINGTVMAGKFTIWPRRLS